MTLSTQIWLIRHGETEWSLSGAHTGRTDLPLTANGELQATAIAGNLSGHSFSLVLTSPLQRARDTCRLAGYAKAAEIEPNLSEWDYGDYEGLSTPQIRVKRPGWNLWSDGAFLNGETAEQAAARAQIVNPGAVWKPAAPFGAFRAWTHTTDFSPRPGWVCGRTRVGSSPSRPLPSACSAMSATSR